MTRLILAMASLLIVCAFADPHKSRAESAPPQADPPFRGKIALTAKDSVPDWPQTAKAPEGAPNIVLILLDDVGFGDSSTFGGPAQTPELDKLAAQGLRYNRFHVSAVCSPTRAALLSGRNDHKAGFGIITEAASGYPGYNGIWRKDTVSLAEVLRRHGYSTAAFGKWHNTPYWEISPAGPFDRWPTGLGFEYFYGFMGGENSQWEPTLYRNTTPVEAPATPQQGYFLTNDLVDEAIRWLHTHESLVPEKPYFLYFATSATHVPHQAPKEWIARYRGHFDQGWDKLREETFARQKTLGVIPADAKLTPRPKELPAWDSLPTDDRRLLARQMEVYAGYLAQTDHEVGRLIQAVQEGPQAKNTLIFYIVGDNGAHPGGPEGSEEYGDLLYAPTVKQRLTHLDDLGSEKLRNAYATAWAWASDTPFQSTKGDASHFGGTRDPLIVAWPARITKRGSLRSQFTDANDIAPTIYDVTGIEFPSVVDGVQQQPLDSVSFAYSFDDPSAPSRHRTQVFETTGNRAIYHDGWVAASPHCLAWKCPYEGTDMYDFSKDRWELYHIDTDFSEAHDVAAQHPDELRALQTLFDTEARRNNIYPLLAFDLDKQPWPALGRHEFVYYPGFPRTPSSPVGPKFSLPHRITAELIIPKAGAQGVIVAVGTRYAGFALYVKDDHLVYENHPFGTSRDVITSQKPLPCGRVTVAYEFTRDDTKKMQMILGDEVAPGTGRLYINGQLVGQEKQGPVIGWVLDYGANGGTLGIGQAFGSPVSIAFQPPFPFTGTLERVRVEVR